MKKVIVSAAIMFAAFATNAQVTYEAGSILATGAIGFSSASSGTTTMFGGTTTSTDGPKSSTFNLGLAGGFFVIDRLAVGLGVGTINSKSSSEFGGSEFEDKTSIFVLEPFARWYAPPCTDQLSLFLQLGVGFGFGSNESSETFGGTTETETQDLSGFRTGITPGFSYLFSDRVGLDLRYGFLGYTSLKTTEDLGGGDKIEEKNSSAGLDIDFTTVMLGFLFYF